MSEMIVIQRGDQYALPFPIYVGGELATDQTVSGVRVQIANELMEWPDGDLSFDESSGAWLFPLTEALTRSWTGGARLPVQAGVRTSGPEYRYCPTFYIEIGRNIIEEAWSE